MASTSVHPDEEYGSNDDIPVNTNHASSVQNDLPIVHITSYGYRRGPLQPAPDVIFDMRALPNPPKNVRTGQTGLSKQLREWLFSDDMVQKRFGEVRTTIQTRLDEAKADGEHEITIGVHCELGKHRSVSIVEELAKTRFEGWNVVVDHRDVHLKRSSQKDRSRRGQMENDGSE